MSAFNFEELKRHIGHKIECVVYGGNQNVALECMDCNEVLLDYDKDEEEDSEDTDAYLEYLASQQDGEEDEDDMCCCPECCPDFYNEMDEEEILYDTINAFRTNTVHRHWRGNFYYVEGIAKDALTHEYVVVYHALYGDGEKFVRPFADFIAVIPEENQKDNVTGQTFRFEPVIFDTDEE